MSFLIGLLYVVEVIVCLLLALVVMIQKPKEGGLGGAIGGGMGEAVFGADASNVLIKVTIWLGSIFLVNTLLLARLTSVGRSYSVMGEVSESQPQATEQQAPVPTDAPLPELEEPSEEAAPAAKPAAAPAAKPAAAPAARPAAAPAARPAAAPAAKPAATPAAKPAAAPAAKPAAAPAAKPAATPAAKPAAAPAAKPAAAPVAKPAAKPAN